MCQCSSLASVHGTLPLHLASASHPLDGTKCGVPVLEELLDQHEELRNRIVEANFKWKQAQLMVDYAFKQLNEAVSKWTAVPNIDASRLEEKCVMCLYLFCTHSCILDTAWP